ncbi:hypothetical protein J6590_074225 [Homalodisca vitripennis]|nr:hypothetical protein J6590_074225 [Homalodisca vitripennis]
MADQSPGIPDNRVEMPRIRDSMGVELGNPGNMLGVRATSVSQNSKTREECNFSSSDTQFQFQNPMAPELLALLSYVIQPLVPEIHEDLEYRAGNPARPIPKVTH